MLYAHVVVTLILGVTQLRQAKARQGGALFLAVHPRHRRLHRPAEAAHGLHAHVNTSPSIRCDDLPALRRRIPAQRGLQSGVLAGGGLARRRLARDLAQPPSAAAPRGPRLEVHNVLHAAPKGGHGVPEPRSGNHRPRSGPGESCRSVKRWGRCCCPSRRGEGRAGGSAVARAEGRRRWRGHAARQINGRRHEIHFGRCRILAVGDSTTRKVPGRPSWWSGTEGRPVRIAVRCTSEGFDRQQAAVHWAQHNNMWRFSYAPSRVR
mmetsp:Transcript_34378/g.97378  ORF Transcript_34378/g.97378 Transcript_34378/m.97378 type:complete len:264 (+) Transcript_34378:389-1180(+)